MKDNEYNIFSENNPIKENSFSKEVYTKSLGQEIRPSNDEFLKTNEYHSYNESKSNNKSTNPFKKIIQKVMESANSLSTAIAGTCVVAVTSIVLFANVFVNKPNFDVLSLIEGYNSVEYTLVASELDENIDYYVSIENNNESYQYDITEGENFNIVQNLSHNSVYNFSVVGKNDENQTEVTYLSMRFFTLKENQSLNKFRVVWMVDDKVILEEELQEGTIPYYNKETPMKPSTDDYNYNFIGWDKEMEPISEDVIYNAIFEEVEKNFNASYRLINGNDAIIHWDNPDYYLVELNMNFDNSQDEYSSYRVILTYPAENETFIYEGTEEKALINIPLHIDELTITYELIRTFNGTPKVMDTIEMDTSILINTPYIEMEELILTDVDEYQLTIIPQSDFADLEIYNNIILNITYSDLTTKQIIIDDLLINEQNIVTIDVPHGIDNVNIDYELNFLGNNGHNPRVISDSVSYNLTNEFKLVRTIVDIEHSNAVLFEFIYHFIDDETSISAYNLSDKQSYVLTTYNNTVTCYIDSNNTTGEFAYFLSNLNGGQTGSITNITVDIFAEYTSFLKSYTFNYKNPSDILITYNDDGTINLYTDLGFTTEDEYIYYGIYYSGLNNSEEVFYTDSIARYENVPLDDYSVVYRIYRTINGEEYLLSEIAVSGSISIMYNLTLENAISLENNQLSFTLESYLYAFDENSFVFTIDGIDYSVDPSQIIYEDTSSTYLITYALDAIPTSYSLRFSGNVKYHHEFYDSIASQIQVKGNEYTTIIVKS